MVSRSSNFPILTARNGQIKIWPLYMEHPVFDESIDVNMGGCAPVIFHDEATGTTQYCYVTSAHRGIIILGKSPITTTIGGVTQYCYPATGGIKLSGSTDLVDQRGGKAKVLPRPRRITPQRTIHYYNAEAFFENTIQVGGEALVMFVPAPKFDIYKELQIELAKHPTPPAPKTFTYVAEPSGIKIGGQADEDYFDFKNFILIHDEDIIIADILSTNGNPFITTTFSQNLARQRRDDDEVLEILELL